MSLTHIDDYIADGSYDRSTILGAFDSAFAQGTFYDDTLRTLVARLGEPEDDVVIGESERCVWWKREGGAVVLWEGVVSQLGSEVDGWLAVHFGRYVRAPTKLPPVVDIRATIPPAPSSPRKVRSSSAGVDWCAYTLARMCAGWKEEGHGTGALVGVLGAGLLRPLVLLRTVVERNHPRLHAVLQRASSSPGLLDVVDCGSADRCDVHRLALPEVEAHHGLERLSPSQRTRVKAIVDDRAARRFHLKPWMFQVRIEEMGAVIDGYRLGVAYNVFDDRRNEQHTVWSAAVAHRREPGKVCVIVKDQADLPPAAMWVDSRRLHPDWHEPLSWLFD